MNDHIYPFFENYENFQEKKQKGLRWKSLTNLNAARH